MSIVNPLKEQEMFYTPVSWNELCDMCEASEDPATAYRIAIMTQNLCVKLVNEAIGKHE